MENLRAFIIGVAMATLVTAWSFFHFYPRPAAPAAPAAQDPVFLKLNHSDGWATQIFCGDIATQDGELSKKNLTKLSLCPHDKVTVSQLKPADPNKIQMNR